MKRKGKLTLVMSFMGVMAGVNMPEIGVAPTAESFTVDDMACSERACSSKLFGAAVKRSALRNENKQKEGEGIIPK